MKPTLGKIERDEAIGRTYIPLPGGWEIQTKGKGSTFRICDPSGNRPPVLDDHLHEPLERMARDVHAEIERLNVLIAEHTKLNSDSICARILALNQRDEAQAEANQLRAQVAALEAKVARLWEPVGLDAAKVACQAHHAARYREMQNNQNKD